MTNQPEPKQGDELEIILDKYKDGIMFLHHQIKGQGLTPDEIQAKEDVETDKAKAAIQSYANAAVEEELYNLYYAVEHGSLAEKLILKRLEEYGATKHLAMPAAQPSPNQKGSIDE